MFGNFTTLSEFAKNDSAEQMIQKIKLNRIKEDPNQPRKNGNEGFGEKSLRELADSINAIGLKQPISVREDGENYIINHGARRYRATKILEQETGQDTILAYIDNEYSDFAQVVENIQRSDLSAREIADFIGMQLGKGYRQNEIAQKVGKSPAWVGQYKTLLELPPKLAESFYKKQNITDVTAINDLVTAYKENAKAVDDFLEDESQNKSISRTLIRGFLESLKNKKNQEESKVPPNDDYDYDDSDADQDTDGELGNDAPKEWKGSGKESRESSGEPAPKPYNPPSANKVGNENRYQPNNDDDDAVDDNQWDDEESSESENPASTEKQPSAHEPTERELNKKERDTTKWLDNLKSLVYVSHNGRKAILDINKETQDGKIAIRYADTYDEEWVECGSIAVVGITLQD